MFFMIHRDLYTNRFMGGRPDALIDGLNVELTNKLTLARRPGLTAFSTATYPTPPDVRKLRTDRRYDPCNH